MRIKRLKLVGFKSFVEPAELRIETGLTGIVGPNGCGKSNLLEAIRWVMGESSAKSMRGAGMEDVIFAGTASRPPRDFAEVTISAERDVAEAANDEDSELEVTRRIERGAGSAYRSNGRDVRAKDVALIFADAATGAHSPALVSQGRIGAIISAKPQERRQMLEEAAGISGLHVRRKDAEQKLRAAESNLDRLATILADMDARAGQLRRQAKQAERYRKLSKDILQAEARLIFVRWQEAKAAADAARAEANAASEAVNNATVVQRELTEKQQTAVRELAEARSVAMAARDAASDLSNRLVQLTGERDRIIQRQADLSAQAARMADDGAREGRLTHDAADALARLQAESASLAEQLKRQEEDRPALIAISRKFRATGPRKRSCFGKSRSRTGTCRCRIARCGCCTDQRKCAGGTRRTRCGAVGAGTSRTWRRIRTSSSQIGCAKRRRTIAGAIGNGGDLDSVARRKARRTYRPTRDGTKRVCQRESRTGGLAVRTCGA